MSKSEGEVIEFGGDLPCSGDGFGLESGRLGMTDVSIFVRSHRRRGWRLDASKKSGLAGFILAAAPFGASARVPDQHTGDADPDPPPAASSLAASGPALAWNGPIKGFHSTAGMAGSSFVEVSQRQHAHNTGTAQLSCARISPSMTATTTNSCAGHKLRTVRTLLSWLA